MSLSVKVTKKVTKWVQNGIKIRTPYHIYSLLMQKIEMRRINSIELCDNPEKGNNLMFNQEIVKNLLFLRRIYLLINI